MGKDAMVEAYHQNEALIHKLEERMENHPLDYIHSIVTEQIEKLKALNDALGEALWSVYDEDIYNY